MQVGEEKSTEISVAGMMSEARIGIPWLCDGDILNEQLRSAHRAGAVDLYRRAPYSDKSDTSGFLTVEAEALRPMLVSALKQGIQVENHAIGDRANRFILDEYERAFKAVPAGERKIAEPRWRDEHTQIVNPADLPRFAQLHVIPSMQPSHAIGDLFFASRRIGMERLQNGFLGIPAFHRRALRSCRKRLARSEHTIPGEGGWRIGWERAF